MFVNEKIRHIHLLSLEHFTELFLFETLYNYLFLDKTQLTFQLQK